MRRACGDEESGEMGLRARRGPLTVILDSNFLFLPVQFGIDIFEAIPDLLCRRVRFVLPSPVYEEVERVARRSKGPEKLALELARKCEVVEVQRAPGESVDDLIVRLAVEWKCPVATNDARLRKRLRAEGIPVIYLRGLGKLELDGII